MFKLKVLCINIVYFTVLINAYNIPSEDSVTEVYLTTETDPTTSQQPFDSRSNQRKNITTYNIDADQQKQYAEVEIIGNNRIAVNQITLYTKNKNSLYAFNVYRLTGYYWKEIFSVKTQGVPLDFKVSHTVGTRKTSTNVLKVGSIKPQDEFVKGINGSVINIEGQSKVFNSEELSPLNTTETTFKITGSPGEYVIYQKVYKFVVENKAVHTESLVLSNDGKYCILNNDAYEIESVDYIKTRQPLNGRNKIELDSIPKVKENSAEDIQKWVTTWEAYKEYVYNIDLQFAIREVSYSFVDNRCKI